MTRDEAYEVLRAATHADGFCPSCYEMVVEALEARLPDVPWAELRAAAWEASEAEYERWASGS